LQSNSSIRRYQQLRRTETGEDPLAPPEGGESNMQTYVYISLYMMMCPGFKAIGHMLDARTVSVGENKGWLGRCSNRELGRLMDSPGSCREMLMEILVAGLGSVH
jgi:hypothetical protein